MELCNPPLAVSVIMEQRRLQRLHATLFRPPGLCTLMSRVLTICADSHAERIFQDGSQEED